MTIIEYASRGRAIFAQAKANAASWWRLVGTEPLNGMWQNARQYQRAKSGLMVAFYSFALWANSLTEPWVLYTDPELRCFSDDGPRGGMSADMFDLNDMPAGFECSMHQPFNFVFYVSLLAIVVMLYYFLRRLLLPPEVTGVRFIPSDHDPDQIDARYKITVVAPEYVTLHRKNLESLPADEIERWLKSHIIGRVSVHISPFECDTAFLRGDPTTKPSRFWDWLNGQAIPYDEVHYGRANDSQDDKAKS